MINIGVIGYGYWGPNLVRNFADLPNVHVHTVCDLSAERLPKAKARYPYIQTTTQPSDLFKDPAIDAIAIATPVSTHFALAQQALQAGKHVLLEKPMTATVAEAEQLLELAARQQRVLMVDHTFIYTSAVRKIRELVQSKQLGDLYYYDSVRVNLGLFQHDVNVIWDLAVHDLAIMDYVLGQSPSAVSAIGTAHLTGQPEDMAYLTCFFPNNLIAHFHVNWLAPVKIRRTLIGGSQQMIVYDDLEPSEKIKVYDKGISLKDNNENVYRMLVGYRIGDMYAPQLNPTEALHLEAHHFVNCITSGNTPETDGQAGLRVVRILAAASESLVQNGKVITL
jgi:predicted dehydrogenase